MGNVSVLHLGGLNWFDEASQFNEYFIKSYNEFSDIGYFIEPDIQFPENLNSPHNELLILLQKK